MTVQHKAIINEFEGKAIPATTKQIKLLVSLECRYNISINWNLFIEQTSNSILATSLKINSIMSAIKDGLVKPRITQYDLDKRMNDVNSLFANDLITF